MKKFFTAVIFILLSLVLNAQDMKIYGYDPETKSYTCFIGVINVGEENPESIWNAGGRYGDRNSCVSIWNEKGMYGSSMSDFSPFNENAKYPPKIKDDEGTDYGYFTVDMNCRGRCDYDLLNVICKYHEKISVSLKRWHDEIFR